MSSESGLKVAPSTATRLAEQAGPPRCLAGQLHHAGAPAHVDRVDLAQEGQRLVGAQLTGAGHEGADVLCGRQPPPKPMAQPAGNLLPIRSS